MANQMKFSGEVTAISEPIIGEGKKGTWESVTVVVTETEGEYPQSIAVECFNKQSELEKIAIGATCDVYFNMEASEYKGAFYGSNQLWKVNVLNKAQSAENEPQNSPQEPQNVAPTATDSDLPF